jgi:hypothetical protein
MTNGLISLLTTYLLYPLIALIMMAVAVLVAKKSGLLKNKRLVVFALVSIMVLTVPALLGFLGYHFMPYAYMALAAVYILLGAYNDRLLAWAFNNDELKYRAKIALSLFQLVVAMLLFALVFNLCNDLKYGIWAATAMLSFLLPSLVAQSYRIFIHIPASIYKVWSYADTPDFSGSDNIDHTRLKVVSVELFKREEDLQSTRINVKIPEELLFGEWIKLFFNDYNKKSAHSPIDVDNSGWIFYVKSWALAPRRYLDYDLSVRDNRIREKCLIVAKRVKNVKE